MIKYDSFTKQIQINRGDSTTLAIKAKDSNGDPYTFSVGEKVKLSITEKKNEGNVVFEKTVIVDTEGTTVNIPLSSEDTKIGEIISKPVTYWYEVSVLTLNNEIQTIIGYDDTGAKEFILNPEAGDSNA